MGYWGEGEQKSQIMIMMKVKGKETMQAKMATALSKW